MMFHRIPPKVGEQWRDDWAEIVDRGAWGRWIADLRSGQYVQGYEALMYHVEEDPGTVYRCCLGVACATFNAQLPAVTSGGWRSSLEDYVMEYGFPAGDDVSYDIETGHLPPEVVARLGITPNGWFQIDPEAIEEGPAVIEKLCLMVDGVERYTTLTSVNDSEEFDFDMIADLLAFALDHPAGVRFALAAEIAVPA